jgi:hypothetical protein
MGRPGAARAIGVAQMDASGVVHLHIRPPTRPTPEWTLRLGVPMPPSQERIGYGEIDIDRLNPHYADLLRHLGGLAPGEVKPVMPWRAEEQWHCAIDPYRGPCPDPIVLLPSIYKRYPG